jgi:MoaA/NifB/PqqE/SkfB family radical SAM enzyme
VKFYVTYRCNLRCAHCNLFDAPEVPNELTTADYEHFFRRNPDLLFVSFSGGEPTLRDDLPDLVQLAARSARRPVTVSLNLNGFLVERSRDAVRVALDGLDRRAKLIVLVSSDGPPSVHNRMRGHPEAYERAERTLDALRAMEGPQLEVRRSTCVSPFNLERATAFLAQLQSSGEPHHLCFYQYGSHYDHTERHRDVYRSFRRELPAVLQQIQRTGRAADPVGRIYLDLATLYYAQRRPRSPLPCYAADASVIVGPAGDVLPCINFSRVLGCLPDWGFELDRLLAAERARTTRQQIRQGRCPGCWTPNEAYPTIVCNAFDRRLLAQWLRARTGRSWSGH